MNDWVLGVYGYSRGEEHLAHQANHHYAKAEDTMQRADYIQPGNLKRGDSIFKYSRGDMLVIHSDSGHGIRTDYGILYSQTADYVEVAQCLLNGEPISAHKIEWSKVKSVDKLLSSASDQVVRDFTAQGLYDE